jgi:hypothetical protein
MNLCEDGSSIQQWAEQVQRPFYRLQMEVVPNKRSRHCRTIEMLQEACSAVEAWLIPRATPRVATRG